MDILQRTRLFFWLFIAMVVLNIGVLSLVWMTSNNRETGWGSAEREEMPWMGPRGASPEQQAMTRDRMQALIGRWSELNEGSIDTSEFIQSIRQGDGGRMYLSENLMLRRLNLDQGQIEEIRRLRAEHLREAGDLQKRILQLRRRLLATLAEEDKAMTAPMDSLGEALFASEILKLKHLREARNLLNEEQKVQFDRMLPLTLLGPPDPMPPGTLNGRPLRPERSDHQGEPGFQRRERRFPGMNPEAGRPRTQQGRP